MLPFLFNVLGQQAIKAHAGGLAAMAVQIVAGPGLDGFSRGFSSSAGEAGYLIGQAVGAWLLGFAVTWFSPRNVDPDMGD